MKNLQKKKAQSRVVRIVVALLTVLCMNMNMMNVLAAESTQPALVENTTVERSQAVDAVVPETASQTNADDGIMPLGIGGYAAKYTNPTIGSFTVNASGDGNGSGTFQITTHDFPTSPVINTVLYRPDGSCAGQIYITGNGTKTMRFSNAIPGTYEIVYSVEGVHAGWISAWVSS